jgi:2-C-methyl-D-erythritol 4-phosphate cytidylyltransferase
MNIAVVLVSGQGKRMQGGKNKVLLELESKPLVYYSLKAFQESDKIDSILIVCREEEKKFFQKIVDDYGFSKTIDLVEGGAERQDSAYNAVFYLDEVLAKGEKNFLLFHNGANPFVTAKEIAQSVEMAEKCGACVVAHPTKDTVKEVDAEGEVVKTLERKKLWNMQTPQTIELELAKKAFGQAREEKFMGTDDVSLVERLGELVQVIEGSEFNFKITTPIDLELAKIILKNNQ